MPLNFDNIDVNQFDKTDQTRSVVSEAINVDAAQHAEKRKLSQQTGVPQFAIGNNDDLKNRLKLDSINFDQMSVRNPNTSKFLTDYDNAVIAQNDIPLLQRIEDVVSNANDYGSNLIKSFEKGQSIVESSQIGVKRMHAVLGTGDAISDDDLERLIALDSQLSSPTNDYGFILNTPIVASEQLPILGDILSSGIVGAVYGGAAGMTAGATTGALTGALVGTPFGGVGAAPGALAGAATGAAAGFVPGAKIGGRVGVAKAAFDLESGLAFNEYVSLKDSDGELLDPEISAYAAASVGAINAAMEFASLAALGRTVTPALRLVIRDKVKRALGTESGRDLVKNLGKAYFTSVATETITEGVQEFVTIAGAELAKYVDSGSFTEQNLESVIDSIFSSETGERVVGSAEKGLQASLLLSAPGPTVAAIVDNNQRLKISQNEQLKIDKLQEVTSDSELRNLDKESFKQFIKQADTDQNTQVYIDGAQASLYLNTKTPEQIADDPSLQLISGQIQEALALGGDVLIPIDEFAASITGTETFTALRDSMTLSAESISPFRQQQQQTESENYVKNLVGQAQENASQYVEAQDIYNSVRDQLIDTGVMSPQAASVSAQLVPAWATVYAKSNNITIREAYERSGLVVQGPQTGEKTRLSEALLAQSTIESVDDLNTSIKNMEGIKTVHVFKSNSGLLKVETIIVDNDKRNLGVGTDAMGRILKFADIHGLKTVLTPAIKDDFQGTTSRSRLIKFYKRLGFVENKGRNKDFSISELMFREPVHIFDSTDTNIFKQSAGVDRGYYDPANSIIRLTDAADLSTFLHEFAHFMYEMELRSDSDKIVDVNNWYKKNAESVAKEAGESITPAQVTEFLDNNTTGDVAIDSAIRRSVHEHFARGFEAYLMEGKSPSIELRNAFRVFARWLVQVYKSVKGDLNVNLDDDARKIFDSLIASEEQIAAAEVRAKVEPLFKDFESSGMTNEEFKQYNSQVENAQSKQSETLRDKLIHQITRQTRNWWKEAKADIVSEEVARLKLEKVYIAADRLRNSEVKLDLATTKIMVGEEKTDKLGRISTRIPSALRGMTAPGQAGIHPDAAAAIFGYNSGAEMLSDLVSAPKMKDVAVANAQIKMIEQHGDILTDGTIEQQADEAVLNEERGKLILQELKILSRSVNQPAVDRNMIQEAAVDRIDKLSFRDIHPGKYRKAEVAAAQESATALAHGDKKSAADAKARQVMNYYLSMAATDAKNGTLKIVDRMSRYNKKKIRESIQQAENGYWEQVVRILERFEFRKSATLKSVDAVNQDINTWVTDRVENHGDGLIMSSAVLNETYITHWKNIPYAILKGINDSVKNIEHVARYSNKINVMQEKVDFKKVVTDWVDHMNAQPDVFTAQRTTTLESKNWLRVGMAQMTKIPYLASWLDGGERVGMSHNLIMHPLNVAYADEQKLWKSSGDPVMNAIAERNKDDIARHLRNVFIPEIQDDSNDGNLTGGQILSVALNTGNAGNLRKMLLGEGWADPKDEGTINFNNPQLQAVLAHMTEPDWRLVQLIWDQMELLYPQLSEVHRRTTGLVPPKVDPTPVKTSFGTFTGGYYPVVYDSNRSHRAALNRDRADAQVESMFGGTMSLQASISVGSTNERTGYYAPINFNLDVVPNHFQETIHYITHHDAVRQINKLISNAEVRTVVTAKLGQAEYAQLRPWLNDVAKDGRASPAKTFIDAVFNRLRTGTTLGVMGFKASTGIIQLAGVFNTYAEVGSTHTHKAMRTIYSRGISSMRDATEFAVVNSNIMENRTQTMDREIKSAMSSLKDQRNILAAVQEASMKHIALIQFYGADLISWHAAYTKKLEETGDVDKAYRYGDWVVENVQGSGNTKDMATLFRNQSKTHTTFTMFMTFFSALWNMQRDLGRGAKSGQYSITNTAAKAMFLFTLPVLFESMMRDEVDLDDEELGQKMLTKLALYPVSSIPFVRDVASGVGSNYGYNSTPVSSILEQGLAGVKGLAGVALTDSELTKSQVKNATRLAGAAFKIPGVSQSWASGEHLYEVISEGEQFTFHELLFGNKNRDIQ